MCSMGTIYDACLLVWHHRLVAHAAGVSLARLVSLHSNRLVGLASLGLHLRWLCRGLGLLVGLLLSRGRRLGLALLVALLLRECRLVPLGDDLRVLLLLLLLVGGRTVSRGIIIFDGRLLVSDDFVSRDGIISDGRLAMRHLCGGGGRHAHGHADRETQVSAIAGAWG